MRLRCNRSCCSSIKSKWTVIHMVVLSVFISSLVYTRLISHNGIVQQSKDLTEMNGTIQANTSLTGTNITIMTHKSQIAEIIKQKPESLPQILHDPASTKPTNESKPTKVLLVTYFRGGSTFLGESFNKNPDAFYWFEPLKSIVVDLKMDTPDDYQVEREGAHAMLSNGSMVDFPDEYVDRLVEAVVHILNCRFDKLEKGVLSHFILIQQLKSVSMTEYVKCLRIAAKNEGRKDTEARVVFPDRAISKCLPSAIKRCKRTKIRSLKTIRFGGYALERLMKVDPSIKIIHYVRDPRGMFTSMEKLWTRKATVKHAEGWARPFCQRMYQDFKYFEKFPNILEIRYEDLASSFNQTLHQVYKYIGHEVTSTLKKWFIENTASRMDTGLMGTTRKNSTLTAYRWRETLPRDCMLTISNLCKDVLKHYGYELSE